MENRINVTTYIYSFNQDIKKIQTEINKYEEKRKYSHQEKLDEFIDKCRDKSEFKKNFDQMIKKSGKYIIFCEGQDYICDILNKLLEWLNNLNYGFYIRTLSNKNDKEKIYKEFNNQFNKDVKILITMDVVEDTIINQCDGIIIANNINSSNYTNRLLKYIIKILSKNNKETKPDILLIYDTIKNYYNEYKNLCHIRINNNINIISKSDNEIQELLTIGNKKALLSWYDYYSIAKEYYDKYKNLRLPKNYTKYGVNVYLWVIEQINLYIKGDPSLTLEKIDLLNQIKIVWDQADTEEWNKPYQIAKKYYRTNGNMFPKYSYKEEGICLATWLSKQRKAYNNNELTQKQINLLNEIGMIWTDVGGYVWKENYLLAKQYYDTNGNLLVQNTKNPNDNILFTWLQTQRVAYAKNKLSDEQIRLLNEIEMIWIKTSDYAWNKNYELAKKYYEEHGNLLIIDNYKEGNNNLGKWIYRQRVAYRKRTNNDSNNSLVPLTDEQVEKLESIGMIWDIKKYEFENTRITKIKQLKLEKMFLEFLDEYAKENKTTFDSYDDIKKINETFQKKSLCCKI